MAEDRGLRYLRDRLDVLWEQDVDYSRGVAELKECFLAQNELRRLAGMDLLLLEDLTLAIGKVPQGPE